jgi:quercetin dioxygenase-like cupin family protein
MKAVGICRALAVEQDSSPQGHFAGRVFIQRLCSVPDDGEVEIAAVYFDAGARNKPHIHQHDQYLHIVEGQGIVATDRERRLVHAGDMVAIPAGAWHWHGATRDSAMMHLSIRRPESGDAQFDVEQRDWATAYDD